MTLIKKIDVKNHFAERRRNRLHEMHLVTKPVVSPIENPPTEVSEEAFTRDFSLEHASQGGTVTAVVIPASEENA